MFLFILDRCVLGVKLINVYYVNINFCFSCCIIISMRLIRLILEEDFF